MVSFIDNDWIDWHRFYQFLQNYACLYCLLMKLSNLLC